MSDPNASVDPTSASGNARLSSTHRGSSEAGSRRRKTACLAGLTVVGDVMCVEGAVSGERQHQVRRDRHVRHRRRVFRRHTNRSARTFVSIPPLRRRLGRSPERPTSRASAGCEICESCGVQAAGSVTESLLIARSHHIRKQPVQSWWCRHPRALSGGRARWSTRRQHHLPHHPPPPSTMRPHASQRSDSPIAREWESSQSARAHGPRTGQTRMRVQLARAAAGRSPGNRAGGCGRGPRRQRKVRRRGSARLMKHTPIGA